MQQNEFIDLSKEEIKKLNAGYCNQEQHSESWRGGYMYLLKKIEKSFRNDFHEDFLTKIEEIIDQDLDVFE